VYTSFDFVNERVPSVRPWKLPLKATPYFAGARWSCVIFIAFSIASAPEFERNTVSIP